MSGNASDISATVRAIICVDGPEGLVYRVCRLSYTVWQNGSFEYRFEPNYRVIDLLDAPLFDGIPGLDLDMRKAKYVRRNRVPVFISERAPASNREDLWNLLREVGMDHLNQLEWLIRTDMRYSGDNLYAIRDDGRKPVSHDVEQMVAMSINVECSLRELLAAFACGDDIAVDGQAIQDSFRKPMHDTLLALLEKGHRYREQRRGQAHGAMPVGRRRIETDGIAFESIFERYENREITAREAARALGMSESTFYRRLRERRGQRSQRRA